MYGHLSFSFETVTTFFVTTLVSVVMALLLSLKQNMLHNVIQHHFLCNISDVVIAPSMGMSLKYTTMYCTTLRLLWLVVIISCNNIHRSICESVHVAQTSKIG